MRLRPVCSFCYSFCQYIYIYQGLSVLQRNIRHSFDINSTFHGCMYTIIQTSRKHTQYYKKCTYRYIFWSMQTLFNLLILFFFFFSMLMANFWYEETFKQWWNICFMRIWVYLLRSKNEKLLQARSAMVFPFISIFLETWLFFLHTKCYYFRHLNILREYNINIQMFNWNSFFF